MSRATKSSMNRRRWRVLLGLTLAAVGGLLPADPGTAAARGFGARAAAAGFRVQLGATNFPLTSTPVDAGGPLAQASLDSLGNSLAFASFPYPGDVVVAFPGLAAGFGAPGVPPYPFSVASSYPDSPEQKVAYPFGDLSASSTQDASTGQAFAGVPGVMQSVRGHASISQASDETVTASSAGEAAAVTIGPLSIARVSSSAAVTLLPDGTLKRESKFELSGATVSGVGVTLTPDGLKTPAGAVPLPSNAELESALSAAGLHVTYIKMEETADGVVSAGLQITKQQEAGAQGTASVSLILGQASAGIGGAPAPSGFGDQVSPAEEASIGAVSGPVGEAVTEAPAPRISPGTAGRGSRSGGAVAASPAGLARPAPLFNAAGTYLMVVLAGLLSLCIAAVVRISGVGFKWNS